MASTVPHVLLDEDGSVLTAAHFAPGVHWQPGEIVVLGAGLRYKVLERRADGGGTVTLVVEQIAPQ